MKRTFQAGAGILGLLLLMALFSGCSVVDVQRPVPIDLHARWALMPVVDYSETAQAGERVEEIVSSLVRSKWELEMTHYPPLKTADSLVDLDQRQRYEQALVWARKEGLTYGITGSVHEWRYRSGSDGEAAVGLSLQIVDLQNGKTLWTATGTRAGWGRETVSGTAQKLLRDILGKMHQN